MRYVLKKLDGQRLTFLGVVERFGEKSGFKGILPTILLVDITLYETGKSAAQHLWFTKGKTWEEVKIGDLVKFDARISDYEKGYRGYREEVQQVFDYDYRLERPTKLIVVKPAFQENNF